MSPLLWRSLLRHLSHHPWQLGLSLLGIALGVAVVLAVDLANASARTSLALSMAQVSGRATHRISGGAQGVPQAVYPRLRLEQGFRRIAPVVTGYASAAERPGKVFRILGIDPLAEAPFRSYVDAARTGRLDLKALLTRPNSALLPPDAGPRDRLRLRIGQQQVTLEAVGRLEQPTLEGLIVTDIATAQALLNQPGRLSHIDLILPEEGDAGERLAGALAPGLRLERLAERSRATAELSAAFSLNLTALSLLALVVGMFLIYNTMTFAVIQRRALLGRLRALGVTRREIFWAVLGEALLLGLAGTLLGGVLGVWLSTALVHLVTRTINDLYYVLSVRELYLAPLSLAKGAALGVLATAVAAWLPARAAAAVPPAAALSRAHLEARWQAALPDLNRAGLGLGIMGAAVCALSQGLTAGFGGLFLMILGCGLVAPGCLVGLARLSGRVTARSGPLVRMAIRDVARHLSRTGVAVAALMVAFAATVGVGVMVDSFRAGVTLWITDLVNADIYIAPPALEDGDPSVPLRPEVVSALRTVPGIAGVSTYRRSEVEVGGRPVALVAVDLAAPAKAGYRLLEGSPRQAWRDLESAAAVIVSEPLAYRRRLRVGDSLVLTTPDGARAFPVAGVFWDYGSEHGRILIHRATYQRHWHDARIGSAAIYAAPGEQPAALRRRLEARLGPLQDLVMRSDRDIQALTLEIFERTFTITQVLRLLALGVALIGVLSALLALQLERAREFALLRATGMTARELGWLVSLQTGFMGLTAGLLAIPVGLGLAGVLILVINRRAFGWTLPFQVDPWMLLQTVALAVAAALLAGAYPIWRTARASPAQALRAE